MVTKRASVSKRGVKRAPKREDKKLRDYELVLIINPELGEEKTGAVVDSISQFITGKEGVIDSVEQWGKRSLAYPIAHFLEGHYVLVRLKLQPALGKELAASLLISEDVLRHLLLRVD
ncbi:30S ribosomal protein S6 [Chloroflexota bacterium]